MKYKADEEAEQEINVYDAPTVNAAHLERIRDQAKKVFRVVERYLQNKEDFNKFLAR